MSNQVIDFCVGWGPWASEPFLELLQEYAEIRRLRCVVCGDDNAKRIIRGLETGKSRVLFHLDSTADYEKPLDLYTRLAYAVRDDGAVCANEPDHAKLGNNKAVLHYHFERAGIPVPYTIVVRNWVPADFKLTHEERRKLGKPFIIKPARGYGKQGVARVGNGSVKEIARARRFDRGDDFLLQEMITPQWFRHRMGWFRAYYIFGEVIPCWWDTRTEHFAFVTLDEYEEYGLHPLLEIIWMIAQVAQMNFFSTEVAITGKGARRRFVTIDYVNDPPDMTLQSFSHCGVPDRLVHHIAERLAEAARRVKDGLDPVEGPRVWFPG